MKISKIIFGFDIDGVLTADDNGEENIWLARASAFFRRPIVKHCFNIDEALGIARDDLEPFLRSETVPILTSVPIRPGCKRVLTRLWQLGHEIHLITARSEFLRPVTEEWLRRHNVPFTELHMSPGPESDYSKGAKCRALGVRFFVDDHAPNCLEAASSGVYTLLYHASHNKDFKCPPGIHRVYDWLEIARHITNLAG